MSTQPVQAVIFDMDGLMLDTEPIARRAWTQAFAERGLAIRDEIYLQVIGRTTTDTAHLFCQAYDLTESAFAQIADRKAALLQAAYQHSVPVKDGLPDLLDFLDARRIPRAVATSTFRDLALHKLRVAGVLGRFDGIVCGDDVARGKPSPDIFLAAVRAIHQPPAGCLVLEDSAAGARGALAAGMRVIIVPDQVQPPPDVANTAWRVCASLQDVREFLSRQP